MRSEWGSPGDPRRLEPRCTQRLACPEWCSLGDPRRLTQNAPKTKQMFHPGAKLTWGSTKACPRKSRHNVVQFMARCRNISIIRYATLQLEHNAQLQNVDLQDDSYTHWPTLRRRVYHERKNNDHALEIGTLQRPRDNERTLGNTTAHWGMATNNAHNIEQDVPINTAGMFDVYIPRTYSPTYRR